MKLSIVFLLAAGAALAQVTPIVGNNLVSPADWSWWFANGAPSETANGLTAVGHGSLIYAGGTGSDSYEVRTKYRINSSGGSYVTYFRASGDANLHANTGSFYAVELTNVTVSAGACSATFRLWRRDGITTSLFFESQTTCAPEFEMAISVRGGAIVAYRPDIQVLWLYWGLPQTYPSSATTLYPGVGVAATPANSGILRVDVYSADTTPPIGLNVPIVSTSGISSAGPTAGKVEMQWQNATDPHSGLMLYQVFRRPISDPNGWQLKGSTHVPTLVDRDAPAGNSYVYKLRAYNLHQNYSEVDFAVNVPAAGAFDPRQVGLRPTGAYWGGAGEQIDMQSGNLNYTLALIQAKSRSGWSVPFSLNYNSQMWRKDGATNGIWYYGRDNGYGHGWKLSAGSILPIYADWYQVAFYLYTDSTGAEYRLDVNNGNVWTGKEGVYVNYDANTNRLYFNDGTFWIMGAESAGTEFDAGTRYPTLMQDTNGNQVKINYVCGYNATCPNSSSRISSVQDITGTYNFNYTNGRLTSIGNNGSSWSLTYVTAPANTPWTPNQVPANQVQMLRTLRNNNTVAIHTFSYFNTGELGEVDLPYGAKLRWTYGEWTSASQRTVREINQRFLKKDDNPATPETMHSIWYDASGDPSREYHYYRGVSDQTGLYDKVWWFDPQRRLQNFDERRAGSVITVRKSFSWSATPVTGQPFIWQVDTTLEPSGGAPKTRRSTQALDQYGNVTTAEEWDYGLNVATRKVYTSTYLSTANHLSRYIRNRLKTVTFKVGAGTSTTILTNLYDGELGAGPGHCEFPVVLNPPAPNLILHDTANYGPGLAPYRGNAYYTTTPAGFECRSRDILGVIHATRSNAGLTTLSPDATKQYAVPSAITTNGYASSMQWDGLLNLTSATGPNSDTGTFGWDAVGRPTSQQGPDGESVAYTYSVATRSNTATTGKRFTKTYLDGLGRAVKVETGYKPTPSTTVVESVTETEYAPCACTPMGKMKRVSQPRKPTDPAVWTTYTYDELGRVLTVTHPPNTGTAGNSGITQYEYITNQVKVTDPAGRWKKYKMNGFGNLAQVEEPKPGGGTYLTNYTYSPFNKLLTVSMIRNGYAGTTAQASITQTRTFTYGPSQRLATTIFPETPGTTTYAYNDDGTLYYKLDYKGVRKYFYTNAKQLQRIEKYPGATSIGTATNEDIANRVTYYYDGHPFSTDFVVQYGASRLVAMEYNGLKEFYSYTLGGRLKKKRLQGLNWKLDVSLEYDTVGKLQYLVYPSGRRVKYTYDDMARQTSVKQVDGSTETDLVNNLAYGVAGELKSMSFRDSTLSAFATQTWSYNNRLQMTGYVYGAAINHEYKYSATANDGKASSRKDHISGEEVVYQYDVLHRLTSAGAGAGGLGGTAPAGQQWGQSYAYDGFGNMTQKVGYGIASGTSTGVPQAKSATNGGVPAGDPGDIDNRIISYGGETYTYAPDNKRVQRYFLDAGVWKTHVYFWMGSMRMGTYNLAASGVTTAVKEDLYAAGRRAAPSDRLGSDLTGGVKLMPYGEDLATVANDRTKFATYHRDATGLDYADQRYYSPGTGRFMTADPYLASGGMDRPSSWNRFAYVGNDPVNSTDPTGLEPNKTFCEAYPDHWLCNPFPIRELEDTEYPPIKAQLTNMAQFRHVAEGYQSNVKNGVYTDCEAMSHYADFMAENAPDHFLDTFKVFFPKEYGGFYDDYIELQSAGRPSGYNNIYQNGYPFSSSQNTRGADQGHHFAFFLDLGVRFRDLDPADIHNTLLGASLGVEISNVTPFNWGDFRLGYAAGLIGYGVATGTIDIKQVGGIIREELCRK